MPMQLPTVPVPGKVPVPMTTSMSVSALITLGPISADPIVSVPEPVGSQFGSVDVGKLLQSVHAVL